MSYPNITICELHTTKLNNDLFNIDRLEDYIPQNPLVHKTHSHNFYHFAFISKGSGSHVIDFKSIDVVPNTIYFMKPHQVHSWNFSQDTCGFVINFSATFLDSNFINSTLLHVLPFFQFGATHQIVYELPQHIALTALQQLELMYQEQSNSIVFKHQILAQQLATFLLHLGRHLQPISQNYGDKTDTHRHLFDAFQELLEQNYSVYKHPKEYATALHISTTLLQSIVKQYAHVTTGDMIRERILLEAKRLLVNKAQTISEIAYQLNFRDNSYFSKFFKKYTEQTPEQFRSSF